MGVAPYLVASAICAVLAQRLVRRICPKCKESYRPPQDVIEKIALEIKLKEYKFYRGKGCGECGNTGYRGRVGLFELMVIDRKMRSLIHTGKSSDAIREAARSAGMKTLWQDGIEKVLDGVTTIEEVEKSALELGGE